MAHVAVLSGDGIGPEIIREGLAVLRLVAPDVETTEALVGGCAYDATGHPLPDETLTLCKSSDAILLGAVGGPKWDAIPDPDLRPERGALLPLRKHLGLFANIRPAILHKSLADASALKPALVKDGLDILVIRELTGGIYFGQPKSNDGHTALDTCVYTKPEVERIAHYAFAAAMQRGKKLCSVDKQNVLMTSVLWRDTVNQVAKEYPEVALSHMLVDNCAMQLIRNPKQFDVIVTENLFGDVLSDEAAMITGSLGMLPSASMGLNNFGLFEPIHGSAPDITGKGIANPLATILSVALLLRYSLHREDDARRIEKAVESVLIDGFRTPDIAQDGEAVVTTTEMGNAVRAALK